MRALPNVLLLAALFGLGACSRTIEVANNDSKGLVAALRDASATPGHETIKLARNGLYILNEEAETGLLLPSLRGAITIEGNRSEIRGYSHKPAALIQVDKDATVRVEHLVLAEGTDGAIRNYGKLRFEDVRIVDSSSSQAQSIVLNHGQLRLRDSAIAYNLLLGNRRDAGTILNYGDIELENSRIHDNRALGRYPTVAVAGGILNFGHVVANKLLLENNEHPEEAPSLSFGGILNLGNGEFRGSTSSGNVREARQTASLAQSF